jgi:hypothetical protein
MGIRKRASHLADATHVPLAGQENEQLLASVVEDRQLAGVDRHRGRPLHEGKENRLLLHHALGHIAQGLG